VPEARCVDLSSVGWDLQAFQARQKELNASIAELRSELAVATASLAAYVNLFELALASSRVAPALACGLWWCFSMLHVVFFRMMPRYYDYAQKVVPRELLGSCGVNACSLLHVSHVQCTHNLQRVATWCTDHSSLHASRILLHASLVDQIVCVCW
jgi:hypothetical protein